MTKEKKIIIRLSGGLGNQMFQYALGRNLAEKNNAALILDISSFETDSSDTKRHFSLDSFNISAKKATIIDIQSVGIPNTSNKSLSGKIGRRFFRTIEYFRPLREKIFVIEPYFAFCPDILEVRSSCYLSGVWQSEKYFKDIEGLIRKEFTLRNKPSIETGNWMEKVSGCNSVSLHIRRGDYVNIPKTNQFHGVCSLEYYDEAMALITQKIANPVFFVFSDDIGWVKENLKTSRSMFYVSDNAVPDYEELIIMSKCKHHIIANSSFSWWGAWLNENPGKIVIAPERWFAGDTDTKDLIPASWIRL